MLFQGTVYDSFCHGAYKVQGTRFGLELECEGTRLPYFPGTFENEDLSDEDDDGGFYRPDVIPKSWGTVQDHSLRGLGVEYVFRDPLGLSDSFEALKELKEGFQYCSAELRPSTRTSTHIHINVQDFEARDLANFLTLYLLVEDALFEVVAPIRQKNLFCWRVRHAPGLIPFWRAALLKGGSADTHEGLHYSGLSIHALWKYGTLEFRALEGVGGEAASWEKVKSFLQIFDNIRRLSLTYEDPNEILTELEEDGPYRLAEKIALRFLGPLNEAELFKSIGSGAKRARLLTRGLDWAPQAPSVPPSTQPIYAANETLINEFLHSTLASSTQLPQMFQGYQPIQGYVDTPDSYWTASSSGDPTS